MVVTLCLLAALAYGLSDFVGGLASRGVSPWAVALTGQLGGGAAVLLSALVLPGRPTASALVWALVAGLGNGAGTSFLYRGLAAGRMGVVAPVSAVGAALVPVVVGLGTGERPGLLVVVGLLAAAPGIWLVAAEPRPARTPTARRPPAGTPPARTPPSGQGDRRGALVDGVLAGLGFGLLFVGLSRVPPEAGPLLLALNLGGGAIVVVALAAALRAPWLPRAGRAWLGTVCGLLGAAATGLFIVANGSGQLTVTAVLVSLYPAFTVVLAGLVLRERVHRTQAAGLALCAVTVALVAAGG